MDFRALFKIAAFAQASDLHLVFGLKPMLRLNGELFDVNDSVANVEGFSGMSFPVLGDKDLNLALDLFLSKEQKLELTKKRELDCGFNVDDVRFRVNVSFTCDHLRIVARVITSHQPTLEEVGLSENVKKILDQKEGLILVVGPTGSGKSTTLAAMINYLNENYRYNIVTFEDPIEFLFTPKKSIISQRQYGSDFLSFPEGLSHVLRQDPNVIMIGEMRDLETIASAITIAETGHLVFATLHTANSAQSIERMIDIFPAHQQNQIKSQLSNILSAVISQHLIPGKDGGRIAAREIMLNNSAVANLIRENKITQLKNVIETSSGEGMICLDHDLKRLYSEGLITKEVALEYFENSRDI
jgi:twitching motility protein PilT